jgi:hypothetical protein
MAPVLGRDAVFLAVLILVNIEQCGGSRQAACPLWRLVN